MIIALEVDLVFVLKDYVWWRSELSAKEPFLWHP